MDYILEVENLRKEYQNFQLKDISFKLVRGYITGFIGPNGAGKSTTIKLIMNLAKRDAGTIKVFGLDNLAAEKEIKERVGFVYDENHYYDELTVLEMKNLFARFYMRWDDQVFDKYLKTFELPSGKKLKDLSKGMKMKFSLALALSHDAELIIMDEPTSGLDPVFRSELLEILSEVILDENKAVFFSTHITTDLDKIADYIIFINRGEIVLSESKESILERYAIVKGDKNLLDGDTVKEFVGIRENRFGFEGLVRDAKRARDLFGERVVIETPSLEEIMVYTVRGCANA